MVALLVAVVLTVLTPAADGSTPGGSPSDVYQLLTNPGLENYGSPYGQFQGADLQVASGWQRFWYGGAEPYWMDGREFADYFDTGWVDRIEGETAQDILKLFRGESASRTKEARDVRENILGAIFAPPFVEILVRGHAGHLVEAVAVRGLPGFFLGGGRFFRLEHPEPVIY